MKLPLTRRYSDHRLLISGLSADGHQEVYKLIDLREAELRETRIDITAERRRLVRFLEAGLGDRVPYGFERPEQLLSYYLHPHSFVPLQSGEIAVSFKQAPYVRVLSKDGEDLGLRYPDRASGFATMLASTTCEVAPGVLLLTQSSAFDRMARYRGEGDFIESRLVEFSLGDEATRAGPRLPGFLIDTVHQVARSSAGFVVAVDMNLSTDGDRGRHAGDLSEPGAVAAYAAEPFPRSRFAVFDEHRRCTTVHAAREACAAHVELDPIDPEVFYLTCHNISKWRTNVVVHGAATLERLRYREGQLERLGAYREPDFFRITSHRVFMREGRRMVAVTGFPRTLFVLDAEQMRTVDRIELFDHEPLSAPFVCPKNTPAPLYIAIGEDGRFALLTGSSTLFVVDLLERRLVDRVDFCEPGSLIATAHINLLTPR